jgi:hypothetical protein
LQEKLKNILVLQRKGLFDQCLKLIKKAKKTAEEHEMDLYVLQLINIQKNIELNLREKLSTEIIKERYEEEKNLLEKQDNINRFFMLYNITVSLVESIGTLRKEDDDNAFKTVIDDPYMLSEDNAKHYGAKVFYYHTLLTYSLAKMDYHASYNYVKKGLELIEAYPEKIKLNPVNYILTLQEVVYFANALKLYDDAREAINKLRELKGTLGKEMTKRQELMIISRTAELELVLILNSRTYGSKGDYLDKIEEESEKFIDEVEHSERLVISYKFAYLYFITADYDKSLKWINRILNDPHRDKRGDVFTFTKILNLMVHFELGNIELLEYIKQSTYTFLKKREKLYKVETYFMQLLNRMLNTISGSELDDAYREFLFNLGRIKDEEFEKGAYVYFEFEQWAQSKIEKKSFREVLESQKEQN